MPRDAVKVSVYINEGDEWNHRPLHLEVLRMLNKGGIAGGTVLRAVAGFTGGSAVQTTSLVDVGGKLPLVIEFIDSSEKIDSLMPQLKRMAGERLVIRQHVQIE